MNLWFYNLKQIRIISPSKILTTDASLDREIRWGEVLYCTLQLLPVVIKAKMRGEYIPLSIILIGRKLTKNDVEWMNEVASKFAINNTELFNKEQ